MNATPRGHRPANETVLDRVRAVCLGLPEVEEKEDWSNTFKVRGKTFAQYVHNHHGDGRVALWCKAPPGAQGLLVDADPARFFIPCSAGTRNSWRETLLRAGRTGIPVLHCPRVRSTRTRWG